MLASIMSTNSVSVDVAIVRKALSSKMSPAETSRSNEKNKSWSDSKKFVPLQECRIEVSWSQNVIIMMMIVADMDCILDYLPGPHPSPFDIEAELSNRI